MDPDPYLYGQVWFEVKVSELDCSCKILIGKSLIYI